MRTAWQVLHQLLLSSIHCPYSTAAGRMLAYSLDIRRNHFSYRQVSLFVLEQ